MKPGWLYTFFAVLVFCSGCSMHVNVDGEIKRFIRETGAGKSGVPPLSPGEFRAVTRKAYNEGEFLDSFLAWLEYKFQYGEEMSGLEGRLLLPKIKDDPRLELCLQLSLGIIPRDKAGIISRLDEMKKENLNRGHIIDLLKGSELARTGEHEKAKGLLLEALKINPYLVEAYKILEEIYDKTGQKEMGRQCLELARNLRMKYRH
ncbi:MAG: hypothetical protein ACM3WV_06860 [Bacillota bacterium]